MPDICPGLFFIKPGAKTKPYDENDIFMPDRFRILDAENLTQVKEVISNISTNRSVQVRLLCCYRMKERQQNYCTGRYVDNPEKRLCCLETGIQTEFLHFHMKMTKSDNVDYLLAFIEGSDLYDNSAVLAQELIKSITWLGITVQQVSFNIFTFGEPVHGTRNISHLDEYIRKQIDHRYNGNIDCDIKHISKKFNSRLSISLKDNYLSFEVS